MKVILKRQSLIVFFIAVCLASSACTQYRGITDNVEVSIGSSDRFSEVEIKSAANIVIKKFADFVGCELLQLWYDETRSDVVIDEYMSSGRGSVNSVEKENVIVLFSNFYVDLVDMQLTGN